MPLNRIEQALEKALACATANDRPPLLSQAMRYAVFPGGARVRARLTLAVANACGNGEPAAADAAAAALELLHCASLVHDDLPCFDDAATRRGKPSVHAQFGEPTALLVGDGLIILAFETLARECAVTPNLLPPLLSCIARSVGMPHGIIAGQAWESEPDIPLHEYHRAKTSSLFVGATSAGAIAAGDDPGRWLALGEALGAAYQVADDLRDTACESEELGKPSHQDAANGRPNAVKELGITQTLERLHGLVGGAIAAIPDCSGAGELQALIESEAKRLVPAKLARTAA